MFPRMMPPVSLAISFGRCPKRAPVSFCFFVVGPSIDLPSSHHLSSCCIPSVSSNSPPNQHSLSFRSLLFSFAMPTPQDNPSSSHMMKTTKRGRPYLKVHPPISLSFYAFLDHNTFIGHTRPLRYPSRLPRAHN